MNKNERFGELLSEGISSVAKREGKYISDIEKELAVKFNYSIESIRRFRKGFIPKEQKTIVFLVRFCVSRGWVRLDWAESFLVQAGFSTHDRIELLNNIFPQIPARNRMTCNNNIPPLNSRFIGRLDDISRVREGLTMPHPLVSIEGMGGVGKTTLAIKVAQMCLSGEINVGIDKENQIDPFDTIVWISAKEKLNGDLSFEEVIEKIAEVFGSDIIHQRSINEKIKEIDRLLRTHRILVIVDNFETVTDVSLADFLQRIPQPSKAIITTREKQLRRLWNVSLSGLTKDESIKKIRDYSYSLGLKSIANADDATIIPLIKITDGNPKAIEMALGYIKFQDVALDNIVRSLGEANETVKDLFVDLFARSWNILPEEGQRVLMVMVFFSDPVSREALGVVADVHGLFLQSVLRQLIEMSLIETDEVITEAKKKYTVHPLVLAFASARIQENRVFEVQARIRWAEYFLQFAIHNIVRELPKERYWNSLLGRDLSVVDSQLNNLLNVLDWVSKNDRKEILIEFSMVLMHYLGRRAYSKRIEYGYRAAEAAKELGRSTDEALLRIDAVGWMLLEIGRLDEAEQELRIGLGIAMNQISKDPSALALVAVAYSFLARVLLAKGDIYTAKDNLKHALMIDCEPVIKYRVNMAAGDVAFKEEDYEKAIIYYKETIKNSQDYGGEQPSAEENYRLGEAYFQLGDFDNAQKHYEAIALQKQFISERDVISVKFGLAKIAGARGQSSDAKQLAEEAIDDISRLYLEHRLTNQIRQFLNELD